MVNKKIKNATECTYNNINFKSKLELYCYKYFSDRNVPILYEPETYVIFPGFDTKIRLYLPVKQRNSKHKVLCLKTRKQLPITYTPDFLISIQNHRIYIDTKGKANDVYPLKRKMFLRYLTDLVDDCEYWFFEPHNQQQVQEVYQLIQNL